jgi:hypothetical protein
MNPSDHPAKGCQDVSGWGLAGLTGGIAVGFITAYYWLIPLVPKVKTTAALTLMTAIVVAAMTLGGAVGYWAMRQTIPPTPPSS